MPELCIHGLSVEPAFEKGIHRWPIADDIHLGSELLFQVLLNADHKKEVLLFQFDHNIDIALIGSSAARGRSKEAEALYPIFGLWLILYLFKTDISSALCMKHLLCRLACLDSYE